MRSDRRDRIWNMETVHIHPELDPRPSHPQAFAFIFSMNGYKEAFALILSLNSYKNATMQEAHTQLTALVRAPLFDPC